jgi:hypothetical protein
MKYVLVIALFLTGAYVLHWMKNAEVGAGLIALGAVLFDPGDVIAAVKAWRTK